MRRLLAVAVVTCALAAPLRADTVPLLADAHTDAAAAENRLGSAPLLRVSASGATYLRFDLSAVPPGSSVANATLTLRLTGLTAPGTIGVHAISAAWTEDTLTHTGRPAWEPDAAALLPVPAEQPAGSDLVLDVTAAVGAWLAGSPNHGLALVSDGTADLELASKENVDLGRPPALELVVTSPTQ